MEVQVAGNGAGPRVGPTPPLNGGSRTGTSWPGDSSKRQRQSQPAKGTRQNCRDPIRLPAGMSERQQLGTSSSPRKAGAHLPYPAPTDRIPVGKMSCLDQFSVPPKRLLKGVDQPGPPLPIGRHCPESNRGQARAGKDPSSTQKYADRPRPAAKE